MADGVARRLPVGAEVQRGGGVHLRVWAPRRRKVEVVLEGGPGAGREPVALTPEPGGYFSGLVAAAGAGTLYRLRLDGAGPFPDPASRAQPEGPHGPSLVVDPSRYEWADAGWAGVKRDGLVLYELHVGTFTREGTWAAAMRELPELKALGVTCVEMMPVAEFPGRFGWGYDGVDLFAPTRLYGAPDDLRRFVDRAHALGLGVILDAVFNHLGPDGNYLGQFSDRYFSSRYKTEWGAPLNFDGDGSGPVRELFASNAAYWIDEFHFDGLRIDATQCIFDASEPHILAVISQRARAAAKGRALLLVGENEPQDTRLLRPLNQGGFGLDAVWNDDFHHAARVAATGRREAYYTDYRGSPQEFVSAAKYGYLYQGQSYRWQKQGRGTPTFGLPASAFVTFLQNHDQVANSACGLRLHQLTSPQRYRALTALLLLYPSAPLLFQGQEFAADAPFVFFADHNEGLAPLVKKGRGEFLAQFPSIACEKVHARLADPARPESFEACKLDLSQRASHAKSYALHRELLRLRREDPVLAARQERRVDGAVLSERAFCLRYFAPEGQRLLVVNLGDDLALRELPEPLLAPPPGARWAPLFHSDDPDYGGNGYGELAQGADGWLLQSDSAVLLAPAPRDAEEAHHD